MNQVCDEILRGAHIRRIILSVTPGGGKSGHPVILAQRLLPHIAEKLLWIAPRNALKYQGEAEFTDPRWQTSRRLRACHGNDEHADRGTDGYLTTFQAVGMKPDGHLQYMRRHPTILFLDEVHHISEDSAWAAAFKPMIEAAELTVFATGTLARGDGQAIAGLDYVDSMVDLRDTEHTRVIRYGRKQAIADGTILQVEPRTVDGAAKWESKEGIQKSVEKLSRADMSRADAIFTALRTEFAFQLLAECMADWQEHRKEYPQAKLLVVAPDIETAKKYHERIASLCLVDIATSEDSADARRVIDSYKRGAISALVTVAMAYEGLSVPEITHIACLTHIRSVPWLEQLFARGNRLAPGKRGAWVYGPADELFVRAQRMIEDEALIALKPEDELFDNEVTSDPLEAFAGETGPKIKPLWSVAHGIEAELPKVEAPMIAPSVAEKTLIQNIRAMRHHIESTARPGSQKALMTVFNHTVRLVVDKSLENMTSDELTAVWMKLRETFSGRL
jgi:superfamily II DNA or RNA helicase